MRHADLSQRAFSKQRCFRLIPSRFPPIALFEDVASQDEFEALYAVQALTNPRIQDEIGNLALLPVDDRVYGIPGCSFVMAAFTHINPDGSRFSSGDYGIYYASEQVETAIAETIYHRERFLSYTQEPPQEIAMRTLVAEFNAALCDLLTVDKTHPVYSLNNYNAGQELGAQIKQNQDDGLVYHSVRAEGKNFALFKAKLIQQCTQGAHYGYVWDGERISTVYQKEIVKQQLINKTLTNT